MQLRVKGSLDSVLGQGSFRTESKKQAGCPFTEPFPLRRPLRGNE